jgi:hypothetical protein
MLDVKFFNVSGNIAYIEFPSSQTAEVADALKAAKLRVGNTVGDRLVSCDQGAVRPILERLGWSPRWDQQHEDIWKQVLALKLSPRAKDEAHAGSGDLHNTEPYIRRIEMMTSPCPAEQQAELDRLFAQLRALDSARTKR